MRGVGAGVGQEAEVRGQARAAEGQRAPGREVTPCCRTPF